MSSDKDVIGKADALLRRHNPGAPGSGTDPGGVPVLTDLVDAPLPDGPVEEIARDVTRKVLDQVERRLAGRLQARVVEELVPHVQGVVTLAVAELRDELSEVVAEAVAAALEGRQVK